MVPPASHAAALLWLIATSALAHQNRHFHRWGERALRSMFDIKCLRHQRRLVLSTPAPNDLFPLDSRSSAKVQAVFTAKATRAPTFCRRPGKARDTLVNRSTMPHIADGRLAVDATLANRVRSGRKQPQRDRCGSSSSLLLLFAAASRMPPSRDFGGSTWKTRLPISPIAY